MNFVELTERTAAPIGTALFVRGQELGTNLRTETVRVKDQWVHGAGRALRGARRQAHPADYRSRIKGGDAQASPHLDGALPGAWPVRSSVLPSAGHRLISGVRL
jgi:hypothetical protein